MNKNLATFLQTIIVLITFCALAFLIWEPQVEGVNANATNFEIYFQDPFLAYAYFSSIAFFLALYKGFKVLGYAKRNMFFSQETLKALGVIKYCGLAMIGFVFLGEVFILSSGGDDMPPAIFMGLLVISISGAINIIATRLEKFLKSKKDLAAQI